MSPRPIRIDEITGVWSFLATVDWEERWLWVLIAFHVACLIITLLTCRLQNVQMLLFIAFPLSVGIVYCSEWINEWAAKNYSLFSAQQYFDSRGVFISIGLSTPLILNCLFILCYWLYTTFHLMIGVKRAKLRHDKKEREKNE